MVKNKKRISCFFFDFFIFLIQKSFFIFYFFHTHSVLEKQGILKEKKSEKRRISSFFSFRNTFPLFFSFILKTKRKGAEKMEEKTRKNEEKIEKKVEYVFNGMLTNQMVQIHPTKNQPRIDSITGEAVIEIGTAKIYIEEYAVITYIRQSVWKLFDFLTIEFTKQNCYKGKREELKREVSVSLFDYISLRSDSRTKAYENKIRKEVKEDLNVLLHISIEGTENQKKKTKEFPKAKICDRAEIKNSDIIFVFSEELAYYLTHSYVMQYPLSILKFDSRNANLYPLGRKLALHYSIDNNIKKGTNKKISVKTALEYCPAIPSYEAVLASDRQINRRIYDAFEKTFEELGLNCQIINSDGSFVDEADLYGMKFSQYQKLYLDFSIPCAFDQTDRIARREDEKVKAKRRKQ